MGNVFKGTNNKIRLIGKIKGLSEENKRVKEAYRSCRNQDHGYLTKQWRLQNAKRSVKADIRHHLLAYALLRGTPYSLLERKCRSEDRPKADVILSIALAHMTEVEMRYSSEWNIEKVEAWLAGRDL